MKNHLKPINIIYLVRVLDGAAFSSVMPFILLHLTKTFGHSASYAGMLLGAQSMVPVFAGIALGVAMTKIERRLALLVSMAALAIASLWIMTGAGGGAGLWMAFVLSGLAFSGSRIAFSSSVPDYLAKEECAQGYALLHSSANVGMALGPVLSGYWVARENYQYALLVPVGLYALSALTVWLGLPKGSQQDLTQKQVPTIKNVLSTLGAPGLALVLSIVGIYSFYCVQAQADLVGLAKYFVDYFGSTQATSFYWTLQSLAIVFVVPLSGRWMKGWQIRPMFIAFACGAALFACGPLSLAFFGPQSLSWAFVSLMLLSIVGESLFVPPFGALLVNLTGTQNAGVIFGLTNTAMSLARAVGASVGGLLLGKAIAMNHLPFYWIGFGAIVLTAFAVFGTGGALAATAFVRRKEVVFIGTRATSSKVVEQTS